MGNNGEDGVFFYVDHTGRHGLICSPADVSTSTTWSNITNTAVGTTAKSFFNGATNTMAIIEQSGHTNSAAQLCLNYSTPGTSAGDWYLPSLHEWFELFFTIYQINKAYNSRRFNDGGYHTSTEYDSNSVEGFNLGNGLRNNPLKSDSWKIVAIRAF